MENELVKIEFDKIIVNNDNAKSILVDIGEEEFWIPKSEIKEMDSGENFVMIPEWLAIKIGLV